MADNQNIFWVLAAMLLIVAVVYLSNKHVSQDYVIVTGTDANGIVFNASIPGDQYSQIQATNLSQAQWTVLCSSTGKLKGTAIC